MDTMDRPVDPTFLRRQRGKRIAYSVAGVAALLWLSVWLPSWIRPALDPDRIRIAQVQWGAVEETITASGTVVPQFEQIIFSPVNTRLVRILQKPGAMLQQGQPIVELDLNAARLDVEKRAGSKEVGEAVRLLLSLVSCLLRADISVFQQLRVFRLLQGVDLLNVLVGHFLDIVEGAPLVVLGHLMGFEQLFEGVVHVTAGASHAVAALLGQRVDDAGHLLPALVGQGRNRDPHHLAVVARVQSEVGA